MKINKYKNDIIAIAILLTTFFIMYFILTKDGYIYGSILDYKDQHLLFPDYLRNLFYETKDFFPDFMANLGSGQNIYNVSYYGLLNPYVLLSYLFPMVDMLTYMTFINIVIVNSSVILFYIYLRKNKYSILVSFLVAFLFLCATPLTFHSHRHIMFINYIPFLITALIGIDRYFEKNKSLVLIISLVLLILSSYFFSVSALIGLFIYGIYKYIKTDNYKNIKAFIIDMVKLAIPFIIAVLISAVLLIPTFYALLSGREVSNVVITLTDLFTINNFMLYDKYSMGLTLVSFISVIFIIFKGKLENKLLGILIILFSIFPIFNFVLNGFMYIDAKSLIPFIPLTLILVAEAFTIIFKGKLKFYHYLLIGYILFSTGYIMIETNLEDNLMEDTYIGDIKNYDNLINDIDDDSFYRVNSQALEMSTVNYLSSADEYKTSLYSSLYNIEYQDNYYELFNNNVSYRNKFITSPSSNILSQIFFSEKYIVAETKLDNNYRLISEEDNLYLYKNDSVLPLGYATNEIINYSDFNKLNDISEMVNIIGSVVTNKETNTEIEEFRSSNIDYEIIDKNDLEITKENDNLIIEAGNDGYLKLKIDNIKTSELLSINFILEPANKDLMITINNIKNKLTNKNWKYYNENEQFNYVISNGEYLEIKFTPGTYKISQIETFIIDYNKILNKLKNIDEFNIDKESTKGDIISGNINVREDSYFTLSIPYDEGFTILVDGKKISYSKVNKGFIGFEISKGYHEIEISYQAPLKNIASIISLIGIMFAVTYIIIERKNKK